MSLSIPRGFVLGRSPDRGRDKSSDQKGGEGEGEAGRSGDSSVQLKGSLQKQALFPFP